MTLYSTSVTYLDALECFHNLRMFLTENVPHVDGRSGFQPTFSTLPMPLLISTQQNEKAREANGPVQYLRTFPALSAVSSAFPLLFSPAFFSAGFFLSLEAVAFAIITEGESYERTVNDLTG